MRLDGVSIPVSPTNEILNTWKATSTTEQIHNIRSSQLQAKEEPKTQDSSLRTKRQSGHNVEKCTIEAEKLARLQKISLMLTKKGLLPPKNVKKSNCSTQQKLGHEGKAEQLAEMDLDFTTEKGPSTSPRALGMLDKQPPIAKKEIQLLMKQCVEEGEPQKARNLI